jgi:hypothetical protein
MMLPQDMFSTEYRAYPVMLQRASMSETDTVGRVVLACYPIDKPGELPYR